MSWRSCTDPTIIREFCRSDPWRYLFHIGDLCEKEWAQSDYFSWTEAGRPRELFFIYRGLSLPCVHLIPRGESLGETLEDALPLLPERGWLHCLAADLPLLRERYRLKEQGASLRMAWDGFPRAEENPGGAMAELLGPADVDELSELLGCAYPNSYFEAAMLAKGIFYGVRERGRLLSCAGLHLHSIRESVAMLGNIATLPTARNRGLARAACAGLLTELSMSIERIALNVGAGNGPALSLYRRLGFREVLRFEELFFEPAP